MQDSQEVTAPGAYYCNCMVPVTVPFVWFPSIRLLRADKIFPLSAVITPVPL